MRIGGMFWCENPEERKCSSFPRVCGGVCPGVGERLVDRR